MTDFTTLSSFSYQLLILLTVILVKAFVSYFIRHEPLRFFQYYCKKLSDKVNKPQNSPKQQMIAGLIAIIITLLPIVIILWAFEVFIEVNFLWQAILLYVSLGSFVLSKSTTMIAEALNSNQNYMAKQTLEPWVLRETESLSSLGLSKTCIEMQLFRTLQQGFTVAFIFVLFGPLMTIGYRLLLEMHYCWNIKLVKYHHFGLYSKHFVNLIQWLPVRFFSFLLLFVSIGKNSLLFWNLSRQYFFQLNNNIALLLISLNLEVKLGGVAIYDDHINAKEKLRKVSFNDQARQPQAKDIIRASKNIHGIIYLSLFIMVLIATAVEFIAANV
jgi:adenosylcobinamide-phosphate synthase